MSSTPNNVKINNWIKLLVLDVINYYSLINSVFDVVSC